MKKKGIISIVGIILIMAVTMFATIACQIEHNHSYGMWTITVEPTMETTGKAKHTCTSGDNHEEEIDIPALSNTEVWTLDTAKSTHATHATQGTDVYTSQYGMVNLATPKLTEHTFGGAWTITKDPTLNDGGKAKRYCTENDGGEEEIDIPALNDAEVWTLDTAKSTHATHASQGTDVYTSQYGTVNLATSKLTEHTFGGAWTITKDPTLNDGGKAKRYCTENDGGEEEIDIPALSNAEVWTLDKDASTQASHETEGKDVYTSQYGKVELVVAEKITDHIYNEWNWKDGIEPTEQSGATATHSCTVFGCDHIEEKSVPALTDNDVWHVESNTEATYTEEGSKVYTSEYGTITVEIPRLTPPFANKTYYGGIAIEVNDDGVIKNGNPYVTDSWPNSITLDANGVGIGAGMPFSNKSRYEFKIVNSETGELEIKITSGTRIPDSNDEYEYETAQPKTVKGYLDFQSGIIIMPNNDDLSYFHMVSPYCAHSNSGDKTTVKVSSWGKSALDYAVALTYSYKSDEDESITVNTFIKNGVAYFGVTFTDLKGAEVIADKCFGSAVLYVKKGDETLASVGYDEVTNTMVELDGFEGEYTSDILCTVTLSGFGTLTAVKGDKESTGTYKYNDGTFELLVTIDGSTICYSATIQDHTLTATELKITVSFDMHGHGTQEETKSVYKNVAIGSLPEPTDAEGEYIFRGWYLEESYVILVTEAFKPTDNVTLHAKWEKLLSIKIYQQGEDGEFEEVKVAVGDNILELLQTYHPQKDSYYLDGWYILVGETEVYITSEYSFEENNDGLCFYAHWILAPYIGSYKGSEVYNAGYGSGSVSIDIDGSGKITGSKTGSIISYDRASQIITWQDDKGQENYFFYDEACGILAYNYNGSTRKYLGNDMYILIQGAESGKIDVKFGVKAKSRHDESNNYYAQFIEVQTKSGLKSIFIYDINIYSDITITDAFGKFLYISDKQSDCIKNSKTVVVKDSEGNVLLAVASQGDNFGKVSDTVALDKYFGAYTGSSGELKIDGAGSALLCDNKGTYYVAAEGASYALDLYVIEDGVEVFYEVTIDAATYTLNKAMVNITFDTFGKDTETEGKDGAFNKNIKIKLPIPTDASGEYLFRGWFEDSDLTKSVTTDEDGNYIYTPKDQNATLYAKWIEKVTLTIHYNDNTTDNKVVEYGKGETAEVERPSYKGHSFCGWFTDDLTFLAAWGIMDEETYITSAEMTANLDIYAKWGEPPVYSGEFKTYVFDGQRENGADNGDTIKDVVIDEVGDMPNVSGAPYPFSNNLLVQNYNDEEGTFEFLRVGSVSTFNAFIDKATKIIVVIARGTGIKYSDIVVLIPADYADGATVTGAYWSSGNIRVIQIKKADGTCYGIYLTQNEAPHFNVTFTDMSGNVFDSMSEAYTAETLYIKSGEKIIARFGYNGTTMVMLDGNEGIYNYGSGENIGTIKLNGVSTATISETTGRYETDATENIIHLYINDSYYKVTLNKTAHTYICEKTMVTITLTSAYNKPENLNVNKNIPIYLPTPEDTQTHVFRGWYEDALFDAAVSLDANNKYKPTGDVTLYAKWLEKVTIYVHYGNNIPDATFVYGKGEEGHPTKPDYTNGQVWDGWYTTEDCLEATLWTDGTIVNGNIDLWVKWLDAVVIYGEWIGREIYGTGSTGSNSGGLKSDTEGNVTGEFSGKLESYDPTTGRLIFKRTGYEQWYFGSLDSVNGVLVFNDSTKNTNSFELTNDVHVLVKKGTFEESTVTFSTAFAINDNNKNRLLVLNGKLTVLLYNQKVYGNVKVKTLGGIDMDPAKTSSSEAFSVYTSTGMLIVNFKKSGSTWEGTDGYEGTYTTTDGTVTLNGKGGITTSDEKSGTYMAASFASGYTFDVYLGEGESREYYELNITSYSEPKTAIMTKRMVEITFYVKDSTSNLTQDKLSVNKNIPVALPTPNNDTEVGTGWFTDDSCQVPVTLDESGKYIPIANVTLYTKAAAKVTLTIVWGDHGPQENTVINYPSGTTPNLTAYIPAEDNGYQFGGWYNDNGCSEEYTPEPLTANKSVYCKWVKVSYKIETTGSYAWTEKDGIWTSKGKDSQHSVMKITIKVDGKLSFDWTVDSESGYDWFDIYVNTSSNTKLHKSGKNLKGQLEIEVKAGDVITFDYSKDGSGNDGTSDKATVSNIVFAETNA